MSQSAQVESIFFAALDRESPEARAAFLDDACAGDAEIRRLVQKMLNAHARVGNFLLEPAVGRPSNPGAPGDTQMLNPTTQGDCAAAPRSSDGALERTDGEGSSDNEEIALDFLTPSDRLDSLGRLGHYEVLQVLGRGGFGIVFRAFDETLQRVVAVKVLNPQLAATSPARKRFLREARSSAKVRHEHIVHVYAVEEQPLPYLVMEFVPGETLQRLLDRVGPLETEEVVEIGRQLAEGLAAAHAQSLVHRDIKPANILIETGPHLCVKITDFGLARAADDASMTQSGIIAGTPMYMAPEQARGEPLDHRADLFSLGSVLYTMASGRPPFRASNTLAVLKRVAEDTPRPIPEIIPEVPQWLCDLITRLHAKQPEDRIATALEVSELLQCGMTEMPTSVDIAKVSVSAAVVVAPAPQKTEQLKVNGADPSPKLKPASTRQSRPRTGRWSIAAAGLLLLVAGLGLTEAGGVTNVRGTIVRLFSPDGTLVVEIDDPEVSVQIDGPDLVIKGAGAREIRLQPGKHKLEAIKNGKLVREELVTITNRGRQVVRVSREPASEAKTATIENKGTEPVAASSSFDVAAWERSVAAMTADEQVQAVRARLLELNPESDGNITPTIENDTVAVLAFHSDYVQDITPLRSLKHLRKLAIYGAKTEAQRLSDLSPLKGMQLTDLNVDHNKIADLTPLSGMPLTRLSLWQYRGSDLTPLKGMPLTWLNIGGGKQQLDLSPLAGMPLAYLCVNWSQVSDFGPLQNLPLKELECSNTPLTDAGLVSLKACKQLATVSLFSTQVTAAGITDLQKSLPNCKVIDRDPLLAKTPMASPEAWIKAVSAMPAAEQVKAFSARMKELNPGFDGKVEPTISEDVVTGLRFETEHVSDISPVAAFTKLTVFECCGDFSNYGKLGLLKDLSPLKGLPLRVFRCISAPISNLSPLRGMPLSEINVERTFVSDLSPLEGMPLRSLNIYTTPVSNLTPLRGLPLELLQATGTQVADLSPLEGMQLQVLHCVATAVRDLSPLKATRLQYLACDRTAIVDLSPLSGLPLRSLSFGYTRVFDLSPLKGMPLDSLNIQDIPVTDLSPLQGLPLKWLAASLRTERDRTQVRAVSTLEIINDKSAAEFWNGVDEEEAKLQEWIKQVSTLPADQQVVAVAAKLKERNPDFDGNVTHKIESGVVTELGVGQHVVDISPVRALVSLKSFQCDQLFGGRVLSDLSPLKGMKLTSVELLFTPVTDLSPLQGMPIHNLSLWGTQVSDLTPLKEMPLTDLNCSLTRVTDLSQVNDIKTLTTLLLFQAPVADLAPLKNKSIRKLDIGRTGVTDFNPLHDLQVTALIVRDMDLKDLSLLKNLALTSLDIHHTTVTDLSPLKEMKLTELDCSATKVSDLAPLTGMPLKKLIVYGTEVTDLTPLKGVELEEVRFDPARITQGLDVLREMKSIKRIGQATGDYQPASDFWARYDKGEFKN